MASSISFETPAERVARVVLNYYRQTEEFADEVTNSERMDWYTSLPQTTKVELQHLLPAQWIELPAFKRYLLEKRGFSMHRYVALHLTPAELAHWVDDGDGSVRVS